MASFNKFNAFVADVGLAKHNLGSDTLKVLLTNTAPVATNAVKADLTEISEGNGYTAGGASVPSNAYSQTSGTATLSGNQVVITASGGSIGPFRYAVLYNSTPVAGPLIGWWDYGSSITLASGETLTVQFNSQATGGSVLTVT
jgi:hypothetical protein